jgi:hypothetical protein
MLPLWDGGQASPNPSTDQYGLLVNFSGNSVRNEGKSLTWMVAERILFIFLTGGNRQLPFRLNRTHTGNLPIYSEVSRKGQRKNTIVRLIDGNMKVGYDWPSLANVGDGERGVIRSVPLPRSAALVDYPKNVGQLLYQQISPCSRCLSLSDDEGEWLLMPIARPTQAAAKIFAEICEQSQVEIRISKIVIKGDHTKKLKEWAINNKF